MTLVVAEQTPDGIVAGADTAAYFADKDEIHQMNEPKVFTRNGFLIGFCGSSRAGQVLAHHVEYPDVPKKGDLMPFLVHELVPSIRGAMEEHGPSEGQRILGQGYLIVGCRGELFGLTTDLVVLKTRPFAAIGSGRSHAYGALYALHAARYGTARERLEIALETGAEFSPHVRGPWVFCDLPTCS